MEIGKAAVEGLDMNAAFWQGKKILITGHTGFKGGWLSFWLSIRGASVIGYSLGPPSEPNFFETVLIDKGVISIFGDVCDLDHLLKVVEEYQPEIIIHMAAQSLVRYSYVNPVETYKTNVIGTVNVLEAARQKKVVKAVLIITSDKCYENREWIWGYRENDPMGGFDPYSSSKGCAELVTAAYRNSFFPGDDFAKHGVAVASVRAGNVIGGGDWAADRLVPDIIRAIMNNQPVVIRNPTAVRPWQHVLEPLAGYLLLIEKLWEDGARYGGGWNFGPSSEDCRPVEWIQQQIDKLWPGGATWQLDKVTNPHEANFLKLDCSKAEFLLGWKPKLSLEEALKLVVEWYYAYATNKDMQKITEEQITVFEGAA